MPTDRRIFLKQLGIITAGAGSLSSLPFVAEASPVKKSFFEISLAQWSLHKTLFSNKITNLDFPLIAKKEFGISVVEYVNQFFKDKAKDNTYLNELLKRCKDNGVKNHLIMIDGEGGLANLDEAKRKQAVENHYKWVDAAKYLGCSTIRVNSYGEGSAEDVQQAAIDGLGSLGEYGEKAGINIIVENHGGYSSNGKWLAAVMKGVNKKNVGTLPDFGNFCIKRDANGCAEEYDRYTGVAELMPYAKGASAKTYDFDEAGNCIETDYKRIMKTVKASGFKGYVGIEYEGSKLDEYTGIKKTKELLERIAKTI
ncbi:sugar phosphate isomerase/epimerase family protein [Terrimonas rubra]|uniref:Sugar phosphate isomerase/epimerase family protein n=1 Tax=Terrimonas rubra TaxID=1035890 RepID=A0ABW6AA94_9BACT